MSECKVLDPGAEVWARKQALLDAAPAHRARTIRAIAPSWYALHVRSSQERLVTDQLDYAGIEAFYPHYSEISRDRARHVERKFFPGYVFVRADLTRTNPCDGIPQIVGIVGCGLYHPLALAASEIESVRILAASPLASASAPCALLAKGDLVRVKAGPLRGAEGYVVEAPGKAWLEISLEGLRLARSVEVARDSVERVGPLRRAA